MSGSLEKNGNINLFQPNVFLGFGIDEILSLLAPDFSEPLMILQPDEQEAERIRLTLEVQGFPDFYVCRKWAALLNMWQRHPIKMAVVFHNGFSVSPSELENVPCDLPVKFLHGRFDAHRHDAVTLHRISRRVAQKFFWQDPNSGKSISGQWHQGPEISIIVPIYGVEDYLDRCISSLVNQTQKDIEIILVDDGSKDFSGDIADQWANVDSRIRVFHQRNAGCAAARNFGLDHATGYFVGFVDGDDWVSPEMFFSLLDIAVSFRSEVAQCGYSEYIEGDETGLGVKEHFNFDQMDLAGNGLIKNGMVLAWRRPTIWRRIYQTQYLRENNIRFDSRLPRFDDLPFQFKSLTMASRIAVTPLNYYQYRQLRPGQDIGVSDERLFVHFWLFDGLRPFVKAHFTKPLARAFFKCQLASHHWAYSAITPKLQSQYALASRYDLVKADPEMSRFEKLILAFSLGLKRGLWFLKILLIKGDDYSIWVKLRLRVK